MLFSIAEYPERILWEGALEIETDEDLEQTQRGGVSEGQKLRKAISAMPIVSIGNPEVTLLQDALGLKQIPRELRSKLSSHDFYLARFTCSFRPIHQENTIQWTRFIVNLLSDDAGRQPLAYDLFPKEVVQEVKHQLKISVQPTIKFVGVEIGGGAIEFGQEYLELQPKISAAGEGQSDPSWDYTEVQGATIQGNKRMYLLVKAPKGMLQGQARLDLVADVRSSGGVVAAVLRRQKHEGGQLTVKLWG